MVGREKAKEPAPCNVVHLIPRSAAVLTGQDCCRDRSAPMGIMWKMRPTPVGGCMGIGTGLSGMRTLENTPAAKVGEWAEDSSPIHPPPVQPHPSGPATP
jgi:hypothetical protein